MLASSATSPLLSSSFFFCFFFEPLHFVLVVLMDDDARGHQLEPTEDNHCDVLKEGRGLEKSSEMK